MTWLVDPETQRRTYLAERSLIGRVPLCWVRIDHRSVSKEHAVVAFDSSGWSIKDLGSRNGTWVNGQRLEPGIAVLAGPESKLRFGDVGFMLEGAEPPGVCARSETTGHCLIAEMGILTLPDGENPTACAYEAKRGSWVLDVDGRVQPVLDGDTLFVDNERYRFHVPGANAPRVMDSTVDVSGQLVLSDIKLHLDVSQDHEAISTRIVAKASTTAVPPRITHEVLLLLARQRLNDKQAGVLESECGWIYTDDLAKMLGSDLQKINVDVHRLRQQFAKLGVLDAARVVERRTTTHQVRLGVSEIEIGRTAPASERS